MSCLYFIDTFRNQNDSCLLQRPYPFNTPSSLIVFNWFHDKTGETTTNVIVIWFEMLLLTLLQCQIKSWFVGISCPKDHWTLEWIGLNLYSRGGVFKIAGSGYLGYRKNESLRGRERCSGSILSFESPTTTPGNKAFKCHKEQYDYY